MSVVGLITARGGSKRIPRKNVLELAGKPLIAWSIEEALKSKTIDKVFLSTEDAEIKSVGIEYGAEIIDRPVSLSQDFSLHKDVIRHSILYLKQKLHYKLKHIVLLQPTSPLRKSIHIDNCLTKYMSGDYLSAISVTKSEHHAYKQFILKEDKIMPLFGKQYLNLPGQLLPTLYRQNGAIYAMNAEELLIHDSMFIPPVFFFEMDPISSYDIDNWLDFQICEYLIEKNRNIVKKV